MKITYKIPADELILLDAEKEITIPVLKELIAKHKALCMGRYQMLWNAYKNIYPILSHADKELNKPDNRITVNFAKYLTDTFNGFFIGNPIQIQGESEGFHFVEDVCKLNDQDDNNAELAKIASIFGKSFETLYIDENGDIKTTYLNPLEGFMVYDTTVERRPLAFISLWLDADKKTHGELRTETTLFSFDGVSGDLHFTDEKPHFFGGVPAVEFMENEERMSLFESAYPLICGYQKVLSEKSNDVDYFSDAYLKVLGAELEESQLSTIRNNRIINIYGYDSQIPQVDFLARPESDSTQENLLERLENLIFQTSMVANIADDNFGSSSGVALRYKLFGMQNMARAKERKFVSGLNQRHKLILSTPIAKGNFDDWKNIKVAFNFNFPKNIEEEISAARDLSGILSHQGQLERLSFIGDPEAELARFEAEKQAAFELEMDVDGFSHDHEDDSPEDENA